MHLSESVSSGFFFLAPWLVFAPLIGLLINLIFGRRFSEKMVGTVASLASGAAFVVSVLLAYSVSLNPRSDALPSGGVDPHRHAQLSIGPSASTRSRPR